MFDNDDHTHQSRQVPGERRAIYYVGLVLVIVGFLLFFSVFISAGISMNAVSAPGMMAPDLNPGRFVIRAIAGIGLAILGAILMNIGSRGLAGSGVVLDPQRARKDLEPWSRMAGGMAKDALDEAEIRLGGEPGGQPPAGNASLTFDERIRRLEKLRSDGLISEEEYRRKRAEVLEEKW